MALEEAVGFYPLAKFGVTSKLLSPPEPIKFPANLLVSKNHFKPKYVPRIDTWGGRGRRV